MKFNCLKCGRGWEAASREAAGPCPGCGTAEWDQEFSLDNIGERNVYFITGEGAQTGHVMTLELRGSWNRDHGAIARLSHRLKNDYRHRKGDLGASDGRELAISFHRAAGPDGRLRWELEVRRKYDHEIRKERTDGCRRHRWAIRVVQTSQGMNDFADREHCSCPTDPPCEVCIVAAKFAADRYEIHSDGTRYWADLQHAVMRDLGLLA